MKFGFDDWHAFSRDPSAGSLMRPLKERKQAMEAKRVTYMILAFKCSGKMSKKTAKAAITAEGCPGDEKKTIPNSLKPCQALCDIRTCMM